MVVCISCKKAFENPENTDLCDNCFPRLLEKRVRKKLIREGGVPKGSQLRILGSPAEKAALERMLKNTLGGLPYTILSDDTTKASLTFDACSAEEFAERKWKHIFGGKKQAAESVFVLNGCTAAEIARYNGLLGLGEPGEGSEKSVLGKALHRLELRCKGIFHGLVHATEELEKDGKKSK